MELSYETLRAILHEYYEPGYHIHDTAGEYGEPGYSFDHGATTPLVVLGDYWCRCDKFGEDIPGRNKLHALEAHHPRVWQQMASQGVEFEWYDEWTVDYEADKAYRTTGDSYSWMPSAIYDDCCNLLTPDSDIGEWLEWAVNDPSRCLMSRIISDTDLKEVGFEQFNGGFETGWYDGQDDDPSVVTGRIRAEHGEDVQIVFLLDANGQFDSHWSAYWRDVSVETED